MKLNRTITRGILLTAVALASYQPFRAVAAEPASPPATQPAPERRAPVGLLGRLQQSLNSLELSDAQKKKADALLNQAREELKANAEKFKDDAAARAREARDTFDKLREGVSNVLSDEQKQAFEKNLSLRGPGGLLDRFNEQIHELDLTDAQKQSLDHIMTDARARLEALRDQAQAGGEQTRDDVMKLVTDTLQQLRDVLTPEQKEKLKQRMEERRHTRTDPKQPN